MESTTMSLSVAGSDSNMAGNSHRLPLQATLEVAAAMDALPSPSAVLTTKVVEPTPMATSACQSAKPLRVVASTPFTLTDLIADPSEAVPRTVSVVPET
jgi:hypothetical protein